MRLQGDGMIAPPPERWIHEEWYGTSLIQSLYFGCLVTFVLASAGGKDEPGKYHTTKLGFIKGIDQFDPLEFGISAKEAANFDPAIRLTLEAAQAVRPLFSVVSRHGH
jgi:hypothetical protein